MCRDYLHRKVVGKCSLCGGVVSVPSVFWSVVPPVPTCESCGAVMDETYNLPVVPMKPRHAGWRKNTYRQEGNHGSHCVPLKDYGEYENTPAFWYGALAEKFKEE